MRLRAVSSIAATVILVGSALTGASPGVGADEPGHAKPSPSALEHKIRAMTRQAREYEQTRRRMDRWWTCITPIRVDRVGDPQHGWGFEFDERDGTGIDTRPALVERTRPGRPDLLLLRFSRSRGCITRAPDPNGTGADARFRARSAAEPGGGAAYGGRRDLLGRLEHQLSRLERRITRLEDAFDRFDEWESCLSWLPVTEYGHAHQKLGYLYGADAAEPTYLGALDIDDSEWDDPDYELLTFLGKDRPFSRVECGNEPGESVDRQRVPLLRRTADDRDDDDDDTRNEERSDRLDDIRGDIEAALEDIEDLLEPVEEFVQFDECMFTVGVRNLGSSASGYRFVSSSGARRQTAALSFDMTGLQLPQWDVMAFPGEEPPQIECNEDAGGQNTDE